MSVVDDRPSDQPVFDSRPDTWEHIHTVRGLLNLVVKELLDRSQDHDQTKLVEPELKGFDEFSPRLRATTFNSSEYHELKAGLEEALAHHYATYRHHPEHHPRGIRGMNLIDLLEMFCDWTAATERHEDGDIMQSIETQQDRFHYGDELKEIFENTARALREMAV